MKKKRSDIIIEYLRENPGVANSEIFAGTGLDISSATLKRDLTRLVEENILIMKGERRGARYYLSPLYTLMVDIDPDIYFQKEIDERKILQGYNFELLSLLSDAPLFTQQEYEKLTQLHDHFKTNISKLSQVQYKKEMERLAIDLSWKSSQIEGNTYSLLETERLLLKKETAVGKTVEEATMLLNHKEALDYIINNPHYLQPLTVAKVENIHSLLMKGLGVDRNIRIGRVGITGTNYRPLDNEYQIREALEGMCEVINRRQDPFEKALLLLVLISYIQPFNDGNKRTARIVSNAELMANHYCPISFRTIDSIDYKKAMLLFYEQNNLSAFKQIFIEQYQFAVTTYF